MSRMENPGPAKRATRDSVISKLDIKGEYKHRTMPQSEPDEPNQEVMSDGDEGQNPSLGSRLS